MSTSDDFIKNHIDDAAQFNFEGTDTLEEKQLITLLMIRNNLKVISGWVRLFGILYLIGLVIGTIGG